MPVEQEPVKPLHWGEMPLMGEVLSACDSKITACGKQASIKIVHEAKSTSYTTKSIVAWTTTVGSSGASCALWIPDTILDT